MLDFTKLSDKNGLLNVASGLALLIAATWFSYSVFSARDAKVVVAPTHVSVTIEHVMPVEPLPSPTPEPAPAPMPAALDPTPEPVPVPAARPTLPPRPHTHRRPEYRRPVKAPWPQP